MKRHFGLALPAFVANSTAPRRWQEVTGARCRITGGNFHQPDQLVTPAPPGCARHGGPDEPALVADCASEALQGTSGSGTGLWPVQSRASRRGPDRIPRGRGWWWGMQFGADGLSRPSGRAVLRPLRAAALALLLAGCAEMAPPGTTTVRVEPRSDAEPPLARGETELVVRAVSADAPGREFPGAVCDAVSPYFASRFMAPARLLIPEYGSLTPEVTVSCEAGGVSGRATVAPEATYSGGGFGGPAVGISVGTGGGWNGWDGTGSAWE